MRLITWRAYVLGGVLAAVACDAPDSTPGIDTPAPSADTATTPSSPAALWVAELGDVWVVPADSEGTGIVIFPETPTGTLIASRPLMLISASGDSTPARAVLAPADSLACGEAATIRFSDSVTAGWSVGFIGSRTASLRMDSLAGLPSRDSLRLSEELARLASSIPMDPASRFKGLPFVVLGARQFDLNGRPAIVTRLVRRLPQESAPLEEHTFLIAEGDTSATTSRRWTLVHHHRSEGSEETAEQHEVLAAFRRASSAFLVIARHRESESVYEVLERAPSGWRSRWRRVLSC